MHLVVRFVLVALLCVKLTVLGSDTASDTEAPQEASAKSYTKDAASQQDKRQLPPYSVPVYYDGSAPPPPQPQPQAPAGFLPNWPVIGTLVGNIPSLGGQQSGLFGPSGFGSGFSGLLTNLGIGGLGGQAPPANTNSASCALSQKLTCRCEPLLPLKPAGTRRNDEDTLEIVAQNSNELGDGSRELVAQLSNGLILYQKDSAPSLSGERATQGYYSLKLAEDKYLMIRYEVTNVDYTVKADMSSEPPNSE